MLSPSAKTITGVQGCTHTMYAGTGTITVTAGQLSTVRIAGGTFNAQTYNGRPYIVNNNTWIRTGNQLFRVLQVIQDDVFTTLTADRPLTAVAGAAFQIIDPTLEPITSTLIEDNGAGLTLRFADGTIRAIGTLRSWTFGSETQTLAPVLVDATAGEAIVTNVKSMIV